MKFNLENFTGPLDLLISLIEEEKMDISGVSLSKITEQYLDYLEKIEEIKPDELADFLVIAAKLLLMKSRTLLPELAQDEDNGHDLAAQLKLYKLYLDASKKVSRLWTSGRRSFQRSEPMRIKISAVPPDNFNISAIMESMAGLLFKLKPPKPIPETVIDKTVSMKEKIESIRKFLANAKKTNFAGILGGIGNKTNVIVSFLALLELFKQKALAFEQSSSFGDIIIKKI